MITDFQDRYNSIYVQLLMTCFYLKGFRHVYGLRMSKLFCDHFHNYYASAKDECQRNRRISDFFLGISKLEMNRVYFSYYQLDSSTVIKSKNLDYFITFSTFIVGHIFELYDVSPIHS